MIYIFDKAENGVLRGENAGYQHFLLLQHCFQKQCCENPSLVCGQVEEDILLVTDDHSFKHDCFPI